MNIMTTSFKMPCACTATLTAPSPAAGPCRPALLLETAGHSKASLGQSLVRSLLLSPGSCYTQGFGFFFFPSENLFPQYCVSSGNSMVQLMATSSRGLMPHPGLLHPEPLPLGQATADPYLGRRHTDTQRQVWLGLCGVFLCAQGL